MRWERLFDDLEHRFDREVAAEASAEAVDEARAREAAVPFVDRLAAPGLVVLRTRVGATVRMRLETIGVDWAAGRDADGAAHLLLPLGAVQWARLEPDAGAAAPSRRERIRFAVALRELARRRSTVELTLADDRPTGTIDRVLADHLELAVHPVDQPRRASAVSSTWLVPLAAVDRLRWWG